MDNIGKSAERSEYLQSSFRSSHLLKSTLADLSADQTEWTHKDSEWTRVYITSVARKMDTWTGTDRDMHALPSFEVLPRDFFTESWIFTWFAIGQLPLIR
jgi:hypothetical protein